jgi:ferritin-like protein
MHMADSSNQFHEATAELTAGTMERHRATVSIMEELEAVDWYDQRIDATGDADLAEILRHNRDEEKEHAAMVLEWLRRKDPQLDRQLRRYLFTDGPITEIEEVAEAAEHAVSTSAAGSLSIGALRDKEML